MTNIDHHDNPAINEAAMWIVEQPEALENKFSVVQRQFGLTAVQAAQALTLANKFQTCRRAFA